MQEDFFNILYYQDMHTLKCYIPFVGEFADRMQDEAELMPSTVLSPELALPMAPSSLVSRNQASLNLICRGRQPDRHGGGRLHGQQDDPQRRSTLAWSTGSTPTGAAGVSLAIRSRPSGDNGENI
jgi:hypothetical protein